MSIARAAQAPLDETADAPLDEACTNPAAASDVATHAITTSNSRRSYLRCASAPGSTGGR
jgi:hypothetical protein